MNIQSVNIDSNYKKSYNQNFGQFAFTSETGKARFIDAIVRLPDNISRIYADTIQQNGKSDSLVLADLDNWCVDVFSRQGSLRSLSHNNLLSVIFQTLKEICPNVLRTERAIPDILAECPIISREQALKDFKIST